MTRIATGTIHARARAAFAALGLQYSVDLPEWGPLGTLWREARYFTILTNLLVALARARAALMGRAPGPRLAGGLVLWICIVGLVYHLLLYAPHQGRAFWADHGLHTGVPIAMTLWWLAFGRARLGWRLAAIWLAWPLAYCLYAVARGALDGIYPYFFIDLNKLTAAQFARNFIGLLVAFWLLGLLLVGLTRLQPSPSVSSR